MSEFTENKRANHQINDLEVQKESERKWSEKVKWEVKENEKGVEVDVCVGENWERTAGRGKWRGEGGEIELWEIKWRRDPLSSWNVLVGLSGGRLFVKGHLWVMKTCVFVCKRLLTVAK